MPPTAPVSPLMDDQLSLYEEQRWDLIHLAQGSNLPSKTGIKMDFQIVSTAGCEYPADPP